MKKIVFLAGLLVLISVFSNTAQAVTVCSSGCDVTTIAAALDSEFNGQPILVDPGTYNEGGLRITNRVLLATDPDPTLTIVDATGITGISGNEVLNIQNATIRGFTLRGSRAGIRIDQTLTNSTRNVLENLIIEDNQPTDASDTGFTGGVVATVDSLEITNCIIRNNQSQTIGGGIYFDALDINGITPELIINGSTIIDTVGTGIAIRSQGGEITIRDTMVMNSSSGGVAMLNPASSKVATTLIENTIIQNNMDNGGMSLRDKVTLNNVTIIDNIAGGNGGGIFLADGGDLVVTGGRIEGNQAGFQGGGIYMQGLSTQLSSSATITNNTALEGISGTSGGGIRCQNANTVALLPGSVSGNNPDQVTCTTTDRPPDPIEQDTTADHPYSGTILDPINTFTGELFSLKPRELNLGGPMALYFQRYYAAYLRRANISGDLGNNWRHNFDAKVNINGTTLKYTTHNGRETDFIKNLGSGEWEQQNNQDTPYGVFSEATQDTTIYDPSDDRIYSFDFTTDNIIIGKLVRIEDSHGNLHTVTYDLANGHIQNISDGLGRTLNFTYNNDAIAKISVVNDGTRSISFQYTDPIDSENLTLAIDVRGGTTSFSYKDTSAVADQALMLSMSKPKGNTPLTQTFFDTSTPLSSGRTASQTDASGNTYSLVYDGLDTTITDPLANTRVHSHTATGELANSQDAIGGNIVIGSDTAGRRNSITDRLGDVTSMGYHIASGKLSTITNADGSSSSNSYAERVFNNLSLFDLTTITHTDNTTDNFTFDINGNITLHTDKAGNSASASYNNRGQQLTQTNAAGGVTAYAYNADATLNQITDSANNTSVLSYDLLKRLNQLTFADASTRSFSYDNADNLLTSTDENGNTTTLSYDANGKLSSSQNALLNSTLFAYDGNDRLLSSTDPLGGVSSRSFDQLGRVASKSDPNGNATMLSYDIHNRLTSITDAGFNVWSSTYDVEGIITSRTDPLGNTSNFVSNVLGQITQITSPLGNTTAASYDLMGRLISSTDALGNITTLTRDARGLLTGAELTGSFNTSYSHNALGNMTSVTDANGNSWTRSFDNSGRITASSDPLGNSISVAYNNRRRPSTVTFPGVLGSLNMGYDPAGNLTNSSYSDGTSYNFVYDALNRMTSADGISLGYDANGRITQSNGITIVRDAGGRISNMTLAAGKIVTYSYDTNDRVIQITDWDGGVTGFSYDAAGKLTGITRPSGVNSSKNYDNDGRLSGLSEGSISSINLTRDGNGQITNAIRNLPLQASAENLTGISDSVDAAAQLNGASYDALGRITSDASDSYSWNLATQLTAVNHSGVMSSSTYNALGDRLSRTTDNVTREYSWNYAIGLASVSVIKEAGSDLRYYIHTPGGSLLYSMDAASNARNFYHYDETGNTLFMTDDAGSVTASYAYSPYGRIIASNGTLENLFTWQGQYGVIDEGDGLFYIRARYYDANSGRFISRDPQNLINPNEINPYQYAMGNPLKYLDVTGRESISFELIEPTASLLTLARRESVEIEDRIIELDILISQFGPDDLIYDVFAPVLTVPFAQERITIQILKIDLSIVKSRVEELEAVYDAWANKRLFTMGFPDVFISVDDNQANENPVVKNITTFEDVIAAILRPLVNTLDTLQNLLLSHFSSDREAVLDPNIGNKNKVDADFEKIKSVLPELPEIIVLT